jgi:3',5'-cyclic-AMP phosphodiesterase
MNSLIRKFSLVLFTALILLSQSCKHKSKQKPDADDVFTMAFITDIHLESAMGAVNGLKKVIDTINILAPDMVITGGDLVADALQASEGRADSLFNLYLNMMKGLKVPLYNTMGNHEMFGVYPVSGIKPDHPMYGSKMFQNKIGKTYYSFTHKGWKFFILCSIEPTTARVYTGHISSEQMAWLKSELDTTDKKTPIVLVTHIPFISSLEQLTSGSMAANKEGLVISNSKEVLDLFNGYELRLVLQGHLHFLEDIYAWNTHFITGGAVCAGWWRGPYNHTEEGFLLLHLSRKKIDWSYIDYGWTPQP